MQSGKRVLVTDDDPGILDAMQLMLSRAGYAVSGLLSPQAILRGDAPVPDLYILDKQLSGADGLDVCRFLKAQPATAHIPVIIVSATPHMERLAGAACADRFLEKPFRQRELLEMIAGLLSPSGVEL